MVGGELEETLGERGLWAKRSGISWVLTESELSVHGQWARASEKAQPAWATVDIRFDWRAHAGTMGRCSVEC